MTQDAVLSLYFLLFHLIGMVVTLIYFVVHGDFKKAVQEHDEPIELVFGAFIWEIVLPFVFMAWTIDAINGFFEKKYRVKDE